MEEELETEVKVAEEPVAEEPAESTAEDPVVSATEERAEEEPAEEKLIAEEPAVVTLVEGANNNDSDDGNDDGDGGIPQKVYSVDPFDVEYAAGYICIDDRAYRTDDWKGSNSSRREDTYVDHLRGACFNGTYYDIREYTWTTGRNYWIDTEGTVGGDGVHREFHFYEEGTLQSDHPIEVTFRGVFQLEDCDTNEGYTFAQGLVGIWLHPDTTVTRRDDKTWKGTHENGKTSTGRTDSLWPEETIWAEMIGTPEQPITLIYWDAGNPWIHSSEINNLGCEIHYELVEDGDYALPDGAEPSVSTRCVTYGNYILMEAHTFEGYTFDGWYYDADLTQKVPDKTMMITEDQTFYGTYHLSVAQVVTSVTGGTITPTLEDVAYGEDITIAYEPSEGYLLDHITVDGKEVDPVANQDFYTFPDIHADHTIDVVYVAAKAPVKSVMNQDGKDIAGQQVTDGTLLRYEIKVTNPTGQAQDMVITDTVNAHLVIKSVDNEGKVEGQTITWTLTGVPANTTRTVAFTAQACGTRQQESVTNQAALTIGGVTRDSNTVQNTIERLYKVTTSIVGGTISGSVDDIRTGADCKVTYTPKSGYEIESITVDGKEIDTNHYKDSYTFENITADHEINVVCVKVVTIRENHTDHTTETREVVTVKEVEKVQEVPVPTPVVLEAGEEPAVETPTETITTQGAAPATGDASPMLRYLGIAGVAAAALAGWAVHRRIRMR